MVNEITIVSAGLNSDQGKNQEYVVLDYYSKNNKIQSDSYRIDELLKFINELKPEVITIFTAHMHGRTIVTFLEYFLSKKFKVIIYELSVGHRGSVKSGIIIIKMQKYL